MNTDNQVDHPPHYTAHDSGVECIDVIEGFEFCLAQVLKYVWRAGLKGGEEHIKQDLHKAVWYLDRAFVNRRRGVAELAESSTKAAEVVLERDSTSFLHDVLKAAMDDDLDSLRQLLQAECAAHDS